MFFLIGADGREYGPFTVEQVRQWIAEGRANKYSRVRRNQESTWQALADVPELAEAARRPDTPGAVTPPTLTPEQIAAGYLSHGAVVDIGSALRRAWALVSANPGPLIGAPLLLFVVSFCVMLVPILGWIAMIFMHAPMLGGLYYVFIRRIRGEQAGPSDIFAGFSLAFLQLFLANLVVGILTAVGVILLILPGIYLSVGYLFAMPLVIDKRMEFWTAMEVSRRVVHRHWWSMFGYALVGIVILIAGALALGVGLLIAVPVALAGLMYLYEDLFGRA